MASAVRFDSLVEVPAFTGELILRRVRDSNPRTVFVAPFADLQSTAFDLSTNPPKGKVKASSSGLVTVSVWPFALFATP